VGLVTVTRVEVVTVTVRGLRDVNVCVTVPDVVLPVVREVLVELSLDVTVVEVDVVEVFSALVVVPDTTTVNVDVVVVVPEVKKIVVVLVVVNDVDKVEVRGMIVVLVSTS
jgi:hypothetical protein